MAALILEEVSRVFGGSVRAVDRLNLEIRDRELLVLVGPSGCGKSTTLRLIAGLEQPSAGQVQIAGRVVNGLPAWRRNVAMVFQQPALYPHLDVRQNMTFGLARREKKSGAGADPASGAESIADRVTRVAGWLGIAGLLERRPGQLSGGERQRVALGRAILRQPDVFLLDEPLSNLDPAARVNMRRLVAALHERLPTTTCYVTHDQAEALTLGQRVAVMHSGRIEQVGTPRQVYDQPRNRFVAALVGSPTMSFLPGRLEQSAGQWRFLGRDWAAAVPAQVAREIADKSLGEVLLGLRAEHVRPVGGALVDGAPVASSAAAIRVEIVRTELLGSEQLVELRLDRAAQAGSLVAPVGGEAAVGTASDGLGPGGANGAGSGPAHPGAVGCVWIKVPAALPVRCGEWAEIELDFHHASWFDPASGRNVLWPVAGVN